MVNRAATDHQGTAAAQPDGPGNGGGGDGSATNQQHVLNLVLTDLPRRFIQQCKTHLTNETCGRKVWLESPIKVFQRAREQSSSEAFLSWDCNLRTATSRHSSINFVLAADQKNEIRPAGLKAPYFAALVASSWTIKASTSANLAGRKFVDLQVSFGISRKARVRF